MKQLIYKNPLAVLWMMETHGVRFEVSSETTLFHGQAKTVPLENISCEYWPESEEYLYTFVHDGVSCVLPEEALVMPDSLPLYEPQIGDLYKYTDKYGRTVYYQICHKPDVKNVPHDMNIIERNGKYFMWPDEIREDEN